MSQHSFNLKHTLHELTHYLPSQTPLRDFIHHNSLHAFQHMKFYDAIFHASSIFGYQVTLELKDYRKLYEIGRIKSNILDEVIRQEKGNEEVALWRNKLLSNSYNEEKTSRVGQLRAQWKTAYKIDLDGLVHPLLFRILNSYLDQGVATMEFPIETEGLLKSIKQLEKESLVSLFKTSKARKILERDFSIEELLDQLVGDPRYYEQYLFDQQFSHRGWSGMVATIEARPDTLLSERPITLEDLIKLELLFELDTLENLFSTKWKPLQALISQPPILLFAETLPTELHEVFKLWQNAFEWSYYNEVLVGLQLPKSNKENHEIEKSFQAIFCIDERECSLRRHVESSDPNCETLGSPGFFGVEFYFQPQGAKFYDKLCPAPVTPTFLIKEYDLTIHRPHDYLYTPKTNSSIPGMISSLSLGFASGVRMIQNMLKPTMSPAISNAFSLMDKQGKLTIEHSDKIPNEGNLQVGFTIQEMAQRVEAFLRSIGLISNFAPIIYVVAHGSSSANNPHHGAHDCGACSGRPGAVNARVFSYMANHKDVRLILKERGISIPDQSKFIASLHDTAGDQIEFYDDENLHDTIRSKHIENKATFENALNLNAKERSRRFASIRTTNSLSKVRKAIKDRSVSLFEPRPELGHGTNSLCIVGRREMTKHLFLDRRAFLNSYDYTTDPEGEILVNVMKPLGPVCGGINLEYYFSRVDNHKLGAGTKLPHHVMGLIGVTNSADGDLRPGLPLQMIEVHDPVRLLIVVEHFPEVVLKTIQSVPAMYEWFINEWVHLVAYHPTKHSFHYFKEGRFVHYQPMEHEIKPIQHMQEFIESAEEMKTNYIVDATQENLAIHSIN